MTRSPTTESVARTAGPSALPIQDLADPQRLPTFFILGAAKAATSSICQILASHPQIYFAPNKEPTFFNDDTKWNTVGLTEYMHLYDGSDGALFRGDGSNRYTMRELWPNTAWRIREIVPTARLAYVVRDPLSRIQSYWLEKRSHGGESVHWDFNVSVRRDRHWLVDSTNYLKQLRAYQEFFSPEQIRVFFYEEFAAHPQMVVTDLIKHIGADPSLISLEEIPHINDSVSKAYVRPALSRARMLPAWPAVKAVMSKRLRKWLVRRIGMTTGRPQKPLWAPSTQDWVLAEIGDDLRTFLAEQGRSLDIWPSLTRPPGVL